VIEVVGVSGEVLREAEGLRRVMSRKRSEEAICGLLGVLI
jgi:hypothetical protein